MELHFYFLALLFFLTAIVYSSAGLGGGSTYLALLALFGFSYTGIPMLSLSCNILASTNGFRHFYRAGHFHARYVLPFLTTSIPMSYLGGSMSLSKKTFSILLAVSLFCAALRLFFKEDERQARVVSLKKCFLLGLPIGAILGFLSGLVGIGGGVFLSPLLLLLRWANAKQAAAAASLFILINSLAGLAGQISKGMFFQNSHLVLLPLLGAVFLGSQLGARTGAFRFPVFVLQRVTGSLLLFVSARMMAGL